MSEITKHFHHGEIADESGRFPNKQRKEKPKADLTVSSGTAKIKKGNKLKKVIKKDVSTRPSVQLASVHVSAGSVIGMIDTFDRPADATATGLYAQSIAYAEKSENKPGMRIPKAGYYAGAGVGRARAEYSVFEAEANGPNASFSAEATAVGAGAMARAELASASANAGPLGIRLGLGLDTGASISVEGLEVKFVGTGISIGPRTSVALLGSEVSCSIM